MLVSSLIQRINTMNMLNAMFNKPLIKSPTNFDECKSHFKGLVRELEPENLYCDGEASQGQVNEKLRSIAEVWDELETISGREVEQDDVWNF